MYGPNYIYKFFILLFKTVKRRRKRRRNTYVHGPCFFISITLRGRLLLVSRTSFSTSYNVNLQATNSLGFCICENVFIPLSLLKDSFNGYRFFLLFSLLSVFSLRTLNVPTAFWLLLFPMTSQLVFYQSSCTTDELFFFSLLLSSVLTVMCSILDLFEFILSHWVSWMCRSIFFNKFVKILAIFSSNMFSFFSTLSSRHSQYIHKCVFNVSHISLWLFSFIFILFLPLLSYIKKLTFLQILKVC